MAFLKNRVKMTLSRRQRRNDPVSKATLLDSRMPGREAHFAQLLAEHQKTDEIPFDYARKIVSILVIDPNGEHRFCRECGMWSKPTQAEETFNSIVEKLRWLRQNLELIHPPAGKANVQSMGTTLLDREIRQALMDAEPDADALITKILHRAELEYKFCSAGDADPATLLIQKACTEYKPTEGFPETFYKEVVSKVILYRDTHIEFKLQNGQIV